MERDVSRWEPGSGETWILRGCRTGAHPHCPISQQYTRSNELLKLSSFPAHLYLYTCGRFVPRQPLGWSWKTKRLWQPPVPSRRHDGLAPQLDCGLRKAGPRPPRSTLPLCGNHQPPLTRKINGFFSPPISK